MLYFKMRVSWVGMQSVIVIINAEEGEANGQVGHENCVVNRIHQKDILFYKRSQTNTIDCISNKPVLRPKSKDFWKQHLVKLWLQHCPFSWSLVNFLFNSSTKINYKYFSVKMIQKFIV